MSEDRKIRLNAAFLADVGLAQLPSNEGNVLLSHVYETLQTRVGAVLVRRMSSAQLDEFEALYSSRRHDDALRWLEENAPDYRRVVRDEFDFLTVELRQVAPTILTLAGIRPELT